MRGREHLQEELENLESKAAWFRAEEKMKQQEEAKRSEQQILKSEKGDEKEKERTEKWLERELAAIKEAIRVRKEVAVLGELSRQIVLPRGRIFTVMKRSLG